MLFRILAAAAVVFAGSASLAYAGVLPPVQISEPMSLALYGAGVGALYLVKKLRG
jgi:hypothetical protein